MSRIWCRRVGLLPTALLAQQVGLAGLIDQRLELPRGQAPIICMISLVDLHVGLIGATAA
jgi:hypothetical protein